MRKRIEDPRGGIIDSYLDWPRRLRASLIYQNGKLILSERGKIIAKTKGYETLITKDSNS